MTAVEPQENKLTVRIVYATYFGGNEAAGLEPDLETKELWEAIGCPKDHILPGNMKDNFWGIFPNFHFSHF